MRHHPLRYGTFGYPARVRATPVVGVLSFNEIEFEESP